MLWGKKYPQNVRALQLLTEELIRPVLEMEYSDITTIGMISGMIRYP